MKLTLNFRLLCLMVVLIAGIKSETLVYSEGVPIQVTYDAKTEERFPPKGKYFRLLEDHDLKKHNRPILVIGTLSALGYSANGVNWESMENLVLNLIHQKGADAIINLDQNAYDENDLPFNQKEFPDKMPAAYRLSCDLIVYMDKDQYGHMGFWYNNRVQGLQGVKIEQIIRDSPAQAAGLQRGDILKGIAGDHIGRNMIENTADYKKLQHDFRQGKEYQLLIERKGKPLVLSIVPRAEQEVFDWSQRLGGI